MKTYTCLTIGPVLNTLNMAHKTRELWAASYLFSYFMKTIIKNLQKDYKIQTEDFIIPYPHKHSDNDSTDLKQTSVLKQVGVFPDRLILRSANGLFDILQNAVDKAFEEISSDCQNYIDKEFLGKFLHTYIVEAQMPDYENIVFKMQEYLANCELQSKYLPVLSDNELQFVSNLSKSKFYTKIFGKKHFPSIIQISTKDLNLTDGYFENLGDNEEKIWEKIKKDKNIPEKDLKTAHKYIAIVQADGDNISKLIKEIYKAEPQRISSFSKKLADFSLDAAQKIKSWGAEPIYAGGDDLLFFAPIIKDNENVFNLILQIDEIFHRHINELINYPKPLNLPDNEKPTMSYGVSITYFKYPMHEAIDNARYLLFNKIKKAKNQKKNAIAYKVLKHSGQFFEDVLYKDSQYFQKLKEMFYENNPDILSSIIYNLDTNKTLLKEIAHDQDRLKYFTNNVYNEDIHKNYYDFIEKTNQLIYVAATDNELNSDFDEMFKKVFSGLRLIKFLNRKENE